MYRSTDGGDTWTLYGSHVNLTGVSFWNIDTGYVIGWRRPPPYLDENLRFGRTTDGGQTWTWYEELYGLPNVPSLQEILAASGTTAYVVGNLGRVWKTTNVGTSWEHISPPTTNSLFGESFLDANNGIVVGGGGTILRTSTGGTTWVEAEPASQTLILDRFSLGQNYPNPFNPETKIGFGVSGSGFVSLKVFDVLGREVATLVNEEMRAGRYERTLNANGLSSGIYFYRLRAGSFVETKKLVVLK
jgi:hypothetical protein